MNNEFAKVKYKSQTVLLCERLWRKQRQWKFEVLRVSSEGSCYDLCCCYVDKALQCSLNGVSCSGSCAPTYVYCIFRIRWKCTVVWYWSV